MFRIPESALHKVHSHMRVYEVIYGGTACKSIPLMHNAGLTSVTSVEREHSSLLVACLGVEALLSLTSADAQLSAQMGITAL